MFKWESELLIIPPKVIEFLKIQEFVASPYERFYHALHLQFKELGGELSHRDIEVNDQLIDVNPLHASLQRQANARLFIAEFRE